MRKKKTGGRKEKNSRERGGGLKIRGNNLLIKKNRRFYKLHPRGEAFIFNLEKLQDGHPNPTPKKKKLFSSKKKK